MPDTMMQSHSKGKFDKLLWIANLCLWVYEILHGVERKPWAFAMTVGILALVFSGCDRERRPDKLIVPNGFSGWVTVYYRVAGAPPLPIDNRKNVIRADRRGEISTSSSYETGFAKDEYYFDDGHSLTPIPEEGQGDGPHAWHAYRESKDGRVSDHFFIGTVQEYTAASKNAPPNRR